MEQQLIVLDVDEYGLQEQKAHAIKEIYTPMLEKLSELEDDYNKLVAQEVNKDTAKKAREMRLKIAKLRTSSDKVRRKAKEASKREGDAIQGMYNTILFVVKSKEEKLLEIEQHEARAEAARIETVKAERSAQLFNFNVFDPPEGYGVMPSDVWDIYLDGVETRYNESAAAEKEAEEDRIAKEKSDAEERERFQKENERLNAEAIERELVAKAEADERAKVEAERCARENAEREEREREEAERRASEEAERAKIVAEAERERQKAMDAACKADKAQAALKAKEEAEAAEVIAEVERERIANELEEAQAKIAAEKPDREKLEAYMYELIYLECAPLDSPEYKDILKDIDMLLGRVETHAKKKIKELTNPETGE